MRDRTCLAALVVVQHSSLVASCVRGATRTACVRSVLCREFAAAGRRAHGVAALHWRRRGTRQCGSSPNRSTIKAQQSLARQSWRSVIAMPEEHKKYVRRMVSAFAGCSRQAKEYGSCIGKHMDAIEKNACEKEFLALSSCFRAGLANAKRAR
eukprot:491360-Pleurochrysis_carterae.AAC.4